MIIISQYVLFCQALIGLKCYYLQLFKICFLRFNPPNINLTLFSGCKVK
uniref:Uncharacterized protein n=1 Tax=Siphoviridae sp. ctqzz19 TaxID=2825682 RepID=A0A8S5U291_9CAUD|nr:MAG TPA: hypothetical protein [Siphoviridae sp. ctqzz19]